MNLVAGLFAMILCLAIQVFSLRHALALVRFEVTGSHLLGFWRLAGIMLLLVLVASVQMAIWATIFRLLGEFKDFEEAMYFSGVTFTSLGYGDVTLSEESRLLGPIEAAAGLLMVGISTALFTTVLQQALVRLAASNRD